MRAKSYDGENRKVSLPACMKSYKHVQPRRKQLFVLPLLSSRVRMMKLMSNDRKAYSRTVEGKVILGMSSCRQVPTTLLLRPPNAEWVNRSRSANHAISFSLTTDTRSPIPWTHLNILHQTHVSRVQHYPLGLFGRVIARLYISITHTHILHRNCWLFSTIIRPNRSSFAW